jgi:hypothetical protein
MCILRTNETLPALPAEALFRGARGHANRASGRITDRPACPGRSELASLPAGQCFGPAVYGHFTKGGMDDRIESTFPPVLSPKMVPRSYSRLNST